MSTSRIAIAASRPICPICCLDEWPAATILTGVRADQRACQDCAERAQKWGAAVKFDDPWANPHHEVNQPSEAHR